MSLNIGEEAWEGEVEEGNKDKGKEKHALSSLIQFPGGRVFTGRVFTRSPPPIEYSGVLYVKEGLCIL